ncbi:MAG: helix-turn-helix domain-containing protein [Candidatus Pacearchaeota archaeon]
MINNEIFNLLKIGLTEGEAKVYLALSELGSTTAGFIVKKSGVSYSNVYDILNRLIDKGVVSFIIKNKTKYFQASSPYNLVDYLDKKETEILEQKQSLNKILPDLEKLQEIKPHQEAEIFIGKKGLRTAYEKLLKNSKKGDELLFFYIHDEKYGEDSNLFYNSIVELSSKLKNRGIVNKEYKKSWFANKSKFLTMAFIETPIPGNIDILNDKVLIVSWRDTIFSILIKSKSFADSLKDYFEHMWKISKN